MYDLVVWHHSDVLFNNITTSCSTTSIKSYLPPNLIEPQSCCKQFLIGKNKGVGLIASSWIELGVGK